MERKTFGMQIARLFLTGIVAITLLMFLAPIAVYAGQQGTPAIGVFELMLIAIAFGFVKTKEWRNNETGKMEKMGLLKIDDGLYKDCEKGLGVIATLEKLYADEMGEESPYLGKSNREILLIQKELHRKGSYVPLTAWEKQLIMADIQVAGAYCSVTEKFFATSQSAVLFPAYVSNEIQIGQMLTGIVGELIKRRIIIDSDHYKKLKLTMPEREKQLKRTDEGAEFPVMKIQLGDKTVVIKKFGRILEATYESIARQRLDAVGEALRMVGLQIEIDKTDHLLYTFINGDGDSNAITVGSRTYTQLTSGDIGLKDIIGWSGFMALPYQMNKFVGPKALLNEWKTALANMSGSVSPVERLGSVGVNVPTAFEWDRTTSGLGSGDNDFIGVDQRFAAEEVADGPILVEADKIIRRQINETVVSEKVGYAIDEAAVARFKDI
jgi:hypothetical protein